MKGLRAALHALRDRRRTVRGKLVGIALLVTVTVLMLAGTALLVYDLSVYRTSWAMDISSDASILALSSAPALAFDDRDAAARQLGALRAIPNVQSGALYDAQGALYASYDGGGLAEAMPAIAPLTGVRLDGQNVEVVQAIASNGEFLGTIALRARYEIMNRVLAYLSIFGVIAALGAGLALLLSLPLQAGVTQPLEAIAQAAQRIVDERDYSPRVRAASDDEIGIVVAAFNKMLDEVQERTGALELSNEALTDEVSIRQATEAALARANARLESTMTAAEIGAWTRNLITGEMAADRNYAAFYGMGDETSFAVDPQLWRRQIHPDDLSSVDEAESRALISGLLSSAPYRILRADGGVRWVISRARLQWNASAAPEKLSGLLIDVTAQQQAEQRRRETERRTEEALREADRRKDEFLATLAHELRNPLAPVRHAVQLLGAPAASEQQKQWGREVISRQVRHMALLLDDLLDVSRITRGRLELKREYVALAQLVDSAVETAWPLLESKHHILNVNLPPQALTLNVDPLRLSQALSNLLTNAAKYTDAGGRIELEVRVDDTGLTIRVSDNGIGLSEAARTQVFQMFSQVQSALGRSQGGLGIGLALVRGLVELHGGSVRADSPGLGQGSSFTIQLPAAVLDTGAAPTAPAAEEPALQPSGQAQGKVLVADDNADAADSLASLLQVLGYETCTAYSGSQALELAQRMRPDALILDIGMPDLNGYEVAQRLRLEDWGKQALLIALTGWGQREDIERAEAAGFDRHFSKPVAVSEIERALRRA